MVSCLNGHSSVSKGEGTGSVSLGVGLVQVTSLCPMAVQFDLMCQVGRIPVTDAF